MALNVASWSPDQEIQQHRQHDRRHDGEQDHREAPDASTERFHLPSADPHVEFTVRLSPVAIQPFGYPRAPWINGHEIAAG